MSRATGLPLSGYHGSIENSKKSNNLDLLECGGSMMIPEDQNEEHYTAENNHTDEAGIDEQNYTTAQRRGNNNSKLEKLGKVHLTR